MDSKNMFGSVIRFYLQKTSFKLNNKWTVNEAALACRGSLTLFIMLVSCEKSLRERVSLFGANNIETSSILY